MSIFVFDGNDNSREVLKSYLEELGYAEDLRLFSDYKEGIEQIKTNSDVPIVFADISNGVEELLRQVEQIRSLTPKIAVTSTDYSTDTIIKAMRVGAMEFLPKPVIKEDLHKVISVLERSDDKVAESKIIAVYSNKGGIGKTTIAVNLASELAKNTHNKVALVDLNLQLGDVSTFLNINPSFDVAYVIKNLVAKKENSLLKTFEKYKDSDLYVLSDPNYIEQSESITPQQIEILFKTLRKNFHYVVVDMSSNIDSNSLKILDCSDYIFFTTIVNIPAIRNAQRCLTLFNSRHYPKGKVKIILNRYMENDDIKIEDIETAIGEKIYWKIPNNYFSIMEAINKGVVISEVSSNSNIADSFRNLSIKISDDIVESSINKYRN